MYPTNIFVACALCRYEVEIFWNITGTPKLELASLGEFGWSHTVDNGDCMILLPSKQDGERLILTWIIFSKAIELKNCLLQKLLFYYYITIDSNWL